MVGPSIEGTKLRSNVYRTENADWQEIDVSIILFYYFKLPLHFRNIDFILEVLIILQHNFKVVTVNGAVLGQRDISIHGQNGEGGLLHVLDRVMFPETKGDIVQTLESDPEQRFTTLIKALKSTGLNNEIQDYSSE